MCRTVPKEEWIRKENAHEPIVSEQLFHEANMAYKSRYRPPLIEVKSLSNPLAGVLYCDLCGYAMTFLPRCSKERASGSKRKDSIRCIQASCKSIQRGATFPLVEQKVLEGLEDIVRTFEAAEDNFTPQNRDSTITFFQNQISTKKNELSKLTAQKENLHDLLEQGVYTIQVFMERQKKLNDKIQSVQDQLNKFEQELEHEQQLEKRQTQFIPRIKSVLTEYKSTTDVNKKNRLLKEILKKATYLRKKEWKARDQFEIDLYPRI